ncbi:MAG: glycosyl hydrolase family 3, partial [Clostridia bacterium]|nr:glycosyl hydrolase family 3 [Clostridia bacterium]
MDLRDKPFYLTEVENAWVEKTLEKLSDREKVGQLFCVMGNSFSEEELDRLVSDYSVGAVLFRPLPPDTLIETFHRLDTLAGLPLLKAANLESGGNGAIAGGTLYSQPLGVAAANDPKYACELAEVCANEGRSVGINWSFSPVTDINYNFQNPITHIRSFGSDPDTVRQYSLAYVKALQDGGIAACAKHFPGDGVDFRDHHLHPSCNWLSAEQWYGSFGRNYKALIDAGLLSFMVGHITQPAVQREIDPSLGVKDCLPASLSKELLQGVLRGNLGFNGLISSDATIMRGFNQVMERRKAIPAAIEAGCDMLVFNVNFYEDYAYMLNGLENGLLSRARLDEAVTRVLALKAVTQRHTGLTQRDLRNRQKSRACIER